MLIVRSKLFCITDVLKECAKQKFMVGGGCTVVRYRDLLSCVSAFVGKIFSFTLYYLDVYIKFNAAII